MTDFIGIYENAFSPKYCEEAIELIDKAHMAGYGATRQEVKDMDSLSKDDLQLFPSDLLQASSVFPREFHTEFDRVFWGECYKDYAEKYSILNNLPKHTVHGNKLQKTNVGQGYHIWHCEHGTGEMMHRILAYIVYLNDVEEGGETEFLYQHKRFKPKQGTVVIFPAGFTHTHRGNPPLSNTKYIMTGWVEY